MQLANNAYNCFYQLIQIIGWYNRCIPNNEIKSHYLLSHFKELFVFSLYQWSQSSFKENWVLMSPNSNATVVREKKLGGDRNITAKLYDWNQTQTYTFFHFFSYSHNSEVTHKPPKTHWKLAQNHWLDSKRAHLLDFPCFCLPESPWWISLPIIKRNSGRRRFFWETLNHRLTLVISSSRQEGKDLCHLQENMYSGKEGGQETRGISKDECDPDS